MGNYQGRNRQNSQQLDVSYSNEFELSGSGDGEEEKCLSKKINNEKKCLNSKKSIEKNNDWKYVLDNDDDDDDDKCSGGGGDGGVYNNGNSCADEKEAFFYSKKGDNNKKLQNNDDIDDYHTTEDDEQQFKKNNDKLNGDSMRNLIYDAPLLDIDADDVDDGVYMSNSSRCLNENKNKHSSTETVTSTTSTTQSSSSPSSLASSSNRCGTGVGDGLNLIEDDDIDKFIKYELNGTHATGVKSTTTATTTTTTGEIIEQRSCSGIDDFDSDLEKLKSSLLLGSKLGEAAAKAKLHSVSDSVLSPIPPPPCTPVSGGGITIESIDNGMRTTDKNEQQALIERPTMIVATTQYRNQQLIEDVLLLDESDRGLVPLAQQEEHSFNSLDSSLNNLPLSTNNPPKERDNNEEASTQNLQLLLEQLNINSKPDPVKTESSQQQEQQQMNPLTKLLNQLASTNLIAHRFEYTANRKEHVNDVKLTGSFNNWSEFLQLTKDETIENKWFRDIYLAPGEYEYKYKVNDEWKCDENSEKRGINNYINLAKS